MNAIQTTATVALPSARKLVALGRKYQQLAALVPAARAASNAPHASDEDSDRWWELAGTAQDAAIRLVLALRAAHLPGVLVDGQFLADASSDLDITWVGTDDDEIEHRLISLPGSMFA